DTCPQYIELYIAVAKSGLVLVPVNILFTEHEAAYQLEDSGAVVMFHKAERSEEAKRLNDKFGLRKLIAIDTWEATDGPYEDLLQSGSTALPPEPAEDDLYVLSYTS